MGRIHTKPSTRPCTRPVHGRVLGRVLGRVYIRPVYTAVYMVRTRRCARLSTCVHGRGHCQCTQPCTRPCDGPCYDDMVCNLCFLTGEHFSSISDKQVPTSEANSIASSVNEVLVQPREETAEISVSNSCQVNRQAEQGTVDADLEDSKVKEILSDSKIRETLLDSKIQQLMTYLRSNPDKAHM